LPMQRTSVLRVSPIVSSSFISPRRAALLHDRPAPARVNRPRPRQQRFLLQGFRPVLMVRPDGAQAQSSNRRGSAMKLMSFSVGGKASWGAAVGDGVVDLGKRLGQTYPDLKSLIAGNGYAAVKTVLAEAKPDY